LDFAKFLSYERVPLVCGTEFFTRHGFQVFRAPEFNLALRSALTAPLPGGFKRVSDAAKFGGQVKFGSEFVSEVVSVVVGHLLSARLFSCLVINMGQIGRSRKVSRVAQNAV